ncbi:MAG TPA: hypothetical protein VLG76_02795 [Rhabdochlamydiaceae bacterium]|nr:hypothetical protein [Rhabdochlamydiaceae bacterium]
MSFHDYCEHINWDDHKKLDEMQNFFSFFRPMNLHLQKGVEVWKKYQHLFPSKKFVFKIYHEKPHKEWPVIVLINKQAFIEKVAAHLNDFKTTLGPHISPQGILKKAIESDSFFYDILKMHDGLLGTLLGYGRNNAWLFERKWRLLGSYANFYFPLKPFYSKPSAGFTTVEEELCFLQNKLQGLDNFMPTPFTFIIPIGFMVDREDPETKITRKKFKETQRKMTKIYREGNFLETTLKAFTDTL